MGGGGQAGYERRIEVFVKENSPKKIFEGRVRGGEWGGGGEGVGGDVNEELKFL